MKYTDSEEQLAWQASEKKERERVKTSAQSAKSAPSARDHFDPFPSLLGRVMQAN